MTAIVAMLPDWYCAQYARHGEVSYWQTVCALIYSRPLRALAAADPVWLELLSMLSLLQFMAYLMWGVGPMPALHALQRVGPDWVWMFLAFGMLSIQGVAWIRWNCNNRMASLAIAGVWWGTLSALIFHGGGFLAVHILMPCMAAVCLIAGRQMAVRTRQSARD